jgi:CrcB protein
VAVLFVALGGAIGAVLRYVVSLLAIQWAGAGFPWGTLAVNLMGSFVIGFLWQWFDRLPVEPNVRTFVIIGVLGAFTTFSSYTLDSLRLWQAGKVWLGLVNVVGSNALGLTAVTLGYLSAKQLLTLVK